MPLNWQNGSAGGSADAAERRETLPCVCRGVNGGAVAADVREKVALPLYTGLYPLL